MRKSLLDLKGIYNSYIYLLEEQAHNSINGSPRLDLLILYNTQLTNRMAVICHVTDTGKDTLGTLAHW